MSPARAIVSWLLLGGAAIAVVALRGCVAEQLQWILGTAAAVLFIAGVEVIGDPVL